MARRRPDDPPLPPRSRTRPGTFPPRPLERLDRGLDVMPMPRRLPLDPLRPTDEERGFMNPPDDFEDGFDPKSRFRRPPYAPPRTQYPESGSSPAYSDPPPWRDPLDPRLGSPWHPRMAPEPRPRPRPFLDPFAPWNELGTGRNVIPLSRPPRAPDPEDGPFDKDLPDYYLDNLHGRGQARNPPENDALRRLLEWAMHHGYLT